jgi:hypothetical protein
MRQGLIAALIVLGLLLAGPVLTGPGPAGAQSAEEDPAELAREGMERMLRALTLLIEMIPIYEMPEVMENGDIIIRRKNPPWHENGDGGGATGEEDLEETKT